MDYQKPKNKETVKAISKTIAKTCPFCWKAIRTMIINTNSIDTTMDSIYRAGLNGVDLAPCIDRILLRQIKDRVKMTAPNCHKRAFLTRAENTKPAECCGKQG